MLRPERMSKLSVTGSTAVMDDAIEALHDLDLVHVSDYDGSWEGFDNGTPLAGNDETSERLIQVRSIENILDIGDEDVDGPVDLEGYEDRIEEVREQVNELEDRRQELRDELREVREQRRQIAPFVELGVDVELLGGYDAIDVAVGETEDVEALRRALAEHGDVDEFDVFGDGVVAVAAALADDASLGDVLVGVDFRAIEVPDAEGDPAALHDEFEAREADLQGRLDEIEDEKESLKQEFASFVLAVEEELSVRTQKNEIPLQFATTENAFVAEGWVPADDVDLVRTALHDAVGEHVEVRVLETVDYDDVHHGDDGDVPPTKTENSAPASPFELLVNAINTPKYSELDPTTALLLTFPAFFGFMIGDLGYGALYTVIGFGIWSKMDSPAFKSLGGIAMWAGGFTMLFGVLYGEFFGLHELGAILYADGPPIHKGLESDWALVWLVATVFLALLHLNVGYVFGFVNDLSHGLRDATLENVSWLLLMDGVWIWILAKPQGLKPGFLVGEASVLNAEPVALGFTGLPASVGPLALGVAGIGFVMLLVGEAIAQGGPIGALVGGLESLNVLVNVLSYARIPAVLLAKAGMAFVVNLLVFGAYEVTSHGDTETHFMVGQSVEQALHHHPEASILFPGLFEFGAVGLVGGAVVLVVGHVLVLGLGITSAGLQAVRLEYVEFFGKFYEGGGRNYEPFGYQRNYTTED